MGMSDEWGLVAGYGGIPEAAQLDGIRYRYFKISNDTAIALTSKYERLFNFTEFVKIDSSYLKGHFSFYNTAINKWEYINFFPLETIQFMREDILAIYGYIFTEKDKESWYTNFKWYNPKYQTEDEIEPLLSDIDRHNLLFLAKVIEQYKQQERL
jgi:hypothetical protein